MDIFDSISGPEKEEDIFDRISGPGNVGDENKFRQWYSSYADKLGLNKDPDDPLHFYDWRSAYASGATPDESGHWPSKFKLEGHPNLIIDGVNTKTGESGVAKDSDPLFLENNPNLPEPSVKTGSISDIPESFLRLGRSASKALNKGMQGFMGRLKSIASAVENSTGKAQEDLSEEAKSLAQKTGMVPPEQFDTPKKDYQGQKDLSAADLFGAWEKEYKNNKEYWDDKIEKAGGENAIDEVVGEFLGGSLPGVVEFSMGPVYAGAVGAAEGGPKESAKAAAERYGLGKILHAVNTLKLPSRVSLSALVGAGQAGVEGGTIEDMAKSAGVMALYGATAARGGRSVKEASRDFVETLPGAGKRAEKLEAVERSSQEIKDIFDTIIGKAEETTQRKAAEEEYRPEFLGGKEQPSARPTPVGETDRPEFMGGKEHVMPDGKVMSGATHAESDSSVYAKRPKSPAAIEAPELLEIARELNEGKVPKVVQNLKGKLGVFRGNEATGISDILIRSDLKIGERIAERSIRPKKTADVDSQFAKFKDEIKKNSGIPDSDLHFAKTVNRKTGKVDLVAYHKDPTLANKVIAREIGHLADWYPDRTMKRGDIIGSIASLNKHIGEYLKESPDARGEVLTDADFGRLQKEATRQKLDERSDKIITEEIIREVPRFENVGVTPETILEIMRGRESGNISPDVYRFLQEADAATKKEIVKKALKDMVDERVAGLGKKQVGVDIVKETVTRVEPGKMPTQKEIDERFNELLRKEIAKRRLFEKKVITEELKNLSQKWKPFDPKENKKYTAYRNSARELYADSVSVLLNDPKLLAETAPQFTKAFFNYMERKPNLKKAYEDITARYTNPSEVGKKRLDDIYEMFGRGDVALDKYNKQNLGTVISAKDTIAEWFIDKYQDVLKVVRSKERGRDVDIAKQAKDVRYAIEELQYMGSEAKNYLEESFDLAVKPLLKKGVTTKDFGAYLFAKHIHENRKDIFSARGHDEGTTARLLVDLKERLGDEKFAAVESAAKTYRGTREKEIFPLLQKSGLVSPELMEIIKTRKDHAKMSVTHWLEGKFGAGVTGRIFKQVGSLEDVNNPFISEILQDISLIRAAHVNMAKTKVVDLFFQDGLVKKAEMVKGEAKAPKDSKKKLFTIMREGKPETYEISKRVADSFEYSPFEANTIAHIANVLNAPLRAAMITHNPLWIGKNVFKDFRTTVKNLPEAKLKNIPTLLKSYKQAYGEAGRSVFKGERSDDLKQMAKEGMLVTDRVFGTKEKNYDDELMRLGAEYNIKLNPELNAESQKAYSKIKKVLLAAGKPAKGLYDFVGDVARVTEVSGKLAGYKFLKKVSDRSDKEIAHVVRTRIGTPDYKRQGSLQAITNNIFMYSNVNKEGIRAAYESFTEDKSAYIWKTIGYNVMPKLAVLAAGSQIPWVKQVMDGLTDYEKSHYTIIPLGTTDEGDSIALRIPEDYDGQLWGDIAYKTITGKITGQGGAVSDTLQQMPYHMHPLLKVGETLLDYYGRGQNPEDDYRGKNILPDNVYKTGGVEAAKELGKYAWNNIGLSSFYKFQPGELDKELSTTKELLKLPVINALGSLITVTNAGHAERYRELSDKIAEEDAQRALDSQRRIERHINDNKDATQSEKLSLYKDLKEEKLLPDKYTPKQFIERYTDIQLHGKDDPKVVAMSYAKSNDIKAALLNRFEEEMEPETFFNLRRSLLVSGIINGDVMVEAKLMKSKR